MSDEYGAASGFKGSLVNKSGPQTDDDRLNYETGNYPPPNDTTSSGGYGSPPTSVWSDKAQRGRPDTGLLDQSAMQDAKQGQDDGTRREFKHEMQRDFGVGGPKGLNPYGGDSVESKREAAEKLASQYQDARDRQYESGGAASVEGDGL